MRRPIELYAAFVVVALVTFGYGLIAMYGIPRASGLLGHGIGVLGFVLMLATETLYTLRKRTRNASFGNMSVWLQLHIFMGIVGPYLVLLHTAWEFNGLAGVVAWLTLVVVVSGFIGRYIYTAVPRTANGAEFAIRDLDSRIGEANAALQAWNANQPAVITDLSTKLASLADAPSGEGIMLVLGRTFSRWGYDNQLRKELNKLNSVNRAQARQLQKMLDERYRLQNQRRSLAVARRLLALWHTIHIPIGLAMFALAFVHIIGALYFATLLR